MQTCMESCNNISYMLTNLVAEVGELSGKLAKAIRKDCILFTPDGGAKFYSKQSHADGAILEGDMLCEAGDVLWQLAGLCSVMGWELEDVAATNLEKLASRKERGVIDGNGDHR